MKIKQIIGVAGVIFLIATCLAIISPTASKIATSEQDTDEIIEYANSSTQMDETEKNAIIEKWTDYNQKLVKGQRFKTEEQLEENYYNLISDEQKIMGYVEVPSINVEVPIHLGIDEETLYRYAGHMPNTSMPIGGNSIHSVISAHTAYPGRRFFDDLPEMKKGDEFSITMLDQKMTYKVIKTVTVKPEDMSELAIQNNKNLVSLVTCFPYAINTHRLIVTGELINTESAVAPEKISKIKIMDQPIDYTKQYWSVFVAIGVGILCTIIAIILWLIHNHKLKKKLQI